MRNQGQVRLGRVCPGRAIEDFGARSGRGRRGARQGAREACRTDVVGVTVARQGGGPARSRCGLVWVSVVGRCGRRRYALAQPSARGPTYVIGSTHRRLRLVRRLLRMVSRGVTSSRAMPRGDDSGYRGGRRCDSRYARSWPRRSRFGGQGGFSACGVTCEERCAPAMRPWSVTRCV